MSILLICIIAAMTRFDFSGSLSCNISINAEGTTCHDNPNLSLSQPHWPLTAVGQLFPQVVDFHLRFAVHR